MLRPTAATPAGRSSPVSAPPSSMTPRPPIRPPPGPADPIKPALELYGEVLLAAGRPAEAAAAFEQQLLRTPNRTPSVQGLARARSEAGAPRGPQQSQAR